MIHVYDRAANTEHVTFLKILLRGAEHGFFYIHLKMAFCQLKKKKKNLDT